MIDVALNELNRAQESARKAAVTLPDDLPMSHPIMVHRMNPRTMEQAFLSEAVIMPGMHNVRRALIRWADRNANRRARNYTVYGQVFRMWWRGHLYLSPTLCIYPTMAGIARLREIGDPLSTYTYSHEA